jgi:hypothetical protein
MEEAGDRYRRRVVPSIFNHKCTRIHTDKFG